MTVAICVVNGVLGHAGSHETAIHGRHLSDQIASEPP